MDNVKTVVTMFINGISYVTEIVKIGDLKGGDWMRKELKDLQGCLCEQEEDTEVLLATGDYTILEATKDKFGLTLVAWGEGTVYYKPRYCPFCGRHL